MNLPERYKKSPIKFTNGGMGTAMVYHDRHLDRDVVVKVLHANTPQKRLMDEVRALAAVRSKHVVEIYDVVKNGAGKVRAVVVEYVPGEDLATKLGKCTISEVLKIGFAISSGLADIHKAGQIHRDIKPENMKFDAEGCLKIFDFGLSRSEETDARTEGAVGTLGYLAPELCVEDDEEASFTQAVDVYAFASTMLALVTGRIPKELRSIPPRIPCPSADFTKQNPPLPPVVANILNRCHAFNPADRPTMEEVKQTIGTHLLHNQHRASLVVAGNVYNLHSSNRTVKINSGSLGAFSLSYDGFGFELVPTGGHVYVNNVIAVTPVRLPGSCVVTLGPPSAGINRAFVPVDVSHPEVMV